MIYTAVKGRRLSVDVSPSKPLKLVELSTSAPNKPNIATTAEKELDESKNETTNWFEDDAKWCDEEAS